MNETPALPRRISALDTVLGGALCVLAGVALALALGPGPWTQKNTVLLLAALVAGALGGATLQRLYRAQARRAADAEH